MEVRTRRNNKAGTIKIWVEFKMRGEREEKQGVDTPAALELLRAERPEMSFGRCLKHSVANNYNPRRLEGTWEFEVLEDGRQELLVTLKEKAT